MYFSLTLLCAGVSSRAPPPTSPLITTSANQPTTSHLSWRSILETWVAPAAGAGERAEAGEAAEQGAAGQHAGEDAPKR